MSAPEAQFPSTALDRVAGPTEGPLPDDSGGLLAAYDVLAEFSRDIVLLMRRYSGQIVAGNLAAVAAYGYPRAELLTRTIRDLRAPDTQDEIAGQMGEAIERGLLFETWHRRRDGSIFPVEVSSRGVVLGGVHHLVSIVRDISDRHARDAALRRSEEKFSRAFATNPAAILFTRIETGEILDVNDTWVTMFGYPRAEVIGRPALSLSCWPSGADRARWRDAVRERRSFKDWEQIFYTRSGQPIVTLGSAQVLTVGDDELVVSSWLDITERKQAEERSRLTSQRFDSAIAASSVFVFCQDRHLRYTWVHNAPFDLPPSAMIGATDEEVFAASIDPALSEAKRAVLGTGDPRRVEVRLQRAEAERVYDLLIRAQRDGGGVITGITCAAVDVTDRLTAEQELRAARQAAEAANAAKDHFLAVLSHELRTPLTPVLAVTEMLEQDPALSASQRELVQLARRNIELEARLIDDLLDLTRVLRNKLELQLSPVDVHEKILHVVRNCNVEAAAKALRIATDFGAAQHHVRADGARFLQLLWNLLRNATKFTPHGGRITVRTANVEGWLRIDVTDTGVGIPREALTRIFDAFEQGGREVTRGYGGLGLGLAITKALVEAHGGVITAASDGVGHGATFTMLFTPCPAPIEPAPGTGPGQAAPLQGRVLLVEDHADTRNVLARLLRRLGCEVVAAGSVVEALRQADSQVFDLLVSDIGLPDGTGHELMESLRRRRPLQGIALSGYGMDEDLSRSRAAGFSEHLRKPVNIELLEKTARRLLAAGPVKTP